MSPARLYVLTALILGVVVAGGFGARWIYNAGFNAATLENQNLIQAQRDIAEDLERKVAKSISSIQVKHVTIRQNLEKELTRDVVYRDCVASDRVLGLTNEALTGTGTDTLTDSVVPAPEPIN